MEATTVLVLNPFLLLVLGFLFPHSTIQKYLSWDPSAWIAPKSPFYDRVLLINLANSCISCSPHFSSSIAINFFFYWNQAKYFWRNYFIFLGSGRFGYSCKTCSANKKIKKRKQTRRAKKLTAWPFINIKWIHLS